MKPLLITCMLLFAFCEAGYAQQKPDTVKGRDSNWVIALDDGAENNGPLPPNSIYRIVIISQHDSRIRKCDYPGGLAALNQFIKHNIKARYRQGFLGVDFEVDSAGVFTPLRTYDKRNCVPDIDAIVLPALKKMPRWLPGTDAGHKLVKQFGSIVIDFKTI